MSTLVSIVAVGLLIALHELGHMVIARRAGMRVIRFSVGFFRALISWTSKKSGVIYQIGAVPLGGFVEIKGMNPFETGAYDDPDSYQNMSVLKRAAVLVAGPFANLAIAWVVLFGLYVAGSPDYVNKSTVGVVVPGKPASEAGLETGDQILEIGGKRVTTWDELVERIRVHAGEQTPLLVKRGENKFMTTVTPENQGGVGKIGIGQPQEMVSLPAHVAALAAGIKCYQVVTNTLTSIASAFGDNKTNLETVGPVGIIKMAATTLNTGFREFLALVSYLSLMLFMFNMLPFPALDGGRGIFLIMEAVSRKRINPRAEVLVNSIGFVFLIGILILMTIKDVSTI